MMLGFLLARAGVPVVVLEKHKDFLRDFRGDTIHPSTLELMYELGLLDEFLKLPHSRVTRLSGQVGDTTIHLADFSHLHRAGEFAHGNSRRTQGGDGGGKRHGPQRRRDAR